MVMAAKVFRDIVTNVRLCHDTRLGREKDPGACGTRLKVDSIFIGETCG